MHVLKEILERVKSGKNSIEPRSPNSERANQEEFQPIVKALDFAIGQGYLKKYRDHHIDAHSRLVDFVVIEKLTQKGEAFVLNPTPEAEQLLLKTVGTDLPQQWNRWRSE